ncbi:Uncharacterised protein [Mycobacteroides abscessus subsp. abscessus]|nr:Uncharacterised protein [Mycobacteroides abscessus subsp. abscessus]
MPYHHRGSVGWFPSGRRAYHRLPHAGGCRHPTRRRCGPRRRDQRPFRLDAGQADLPGSRLRHRGAARTTCLGGVPHSRCGHQYSVPAGGARRRRLRCGTRDDVVHRRPPVVVEFAWIGRPRHAHPLVSRGRDGQQAAWGTSEHGVPARQASCPRPCATTRTTRRLAAATVDLGAQRFCA